MARWQYLGGSSREISLYNLFVTPGDVVDCAVCPDAVLFADAGTASVTATLTFPATVTTVDGATLTVRGARLPSTSYAVNDAVCHDGQVWRCVAPYTSSSSDYFNPAQLRHWNRATVANATPGTGTFATPAQAAALIAAPQTTLVRKSPSGQYWQSGVDDTGVSKLSRATAPSRLDAAGFFNAVSVTSSAVVVGGDNGGPQRSIDSGQSWTGASSHVTALWQLKCGGFTPHPTLPSTFYGLFANASNVVLGVSTDNAASWTLGQPLPTFVVFLSVGLVSGRAIGATIGGATLAIAASSGATTLYLSSVTSSGTGSKTVADAGGGNTETVTVSSVSAIGLVTDGDTWPRQAGLGAVVVRSAATPDVLVSSTAGVWKYTANATTLLVPQTQPPTASLFAAANPTKAIAGMAVDAVSDKIVYVGVQSLSGSVPIVQVAKGYLVSDSDAEQASTQAALSNATATTLSPLLTDVQDLRTVSEGGAAKLYVAAGTRGLWCYTRPTGAASDQASTINTQANWADRSGALPLAATWLASHAYALGAVVQPTQANGFVYTCTTAGTTSGTQPTWPIPAVTAVKTVVDGGVTWTRSADSLRIASLDLARVGSTTQLVVGHAAVDDQQQPGAYGIGGFVSPLDSATFGGTSADSSWDLVFETVDASITTPTWTTLSASTRTSDKIGGVTGAGAADWALASEKGFYYRGMRGQGYKVSQLAYQANSAGTLDIWLAGKGGVWCYRRQFGTAYPHVAGLGIQIVFGVSCDPTNQRRVAVGVNDFTVWGHLNGFAGSVQPFSMQPSTMDVTSGPFTAYALTHDDVGRLYAATGFRDDKAGGEPGEVWRWDNPYGATVTLASSAAIGATSVSVTAASAPPTGPYTLEVGTSNAEKVTVSSVTGTGPYTANLSGATTKTHVAGSAFAAPTIATPLGFSNVATQTGGLGGGGPVIGRIQGLSVFRDASNNIVVMAYASGSGGGTPTPGLFRWVNGVITRPLTLTANPSGFDSLSVPFVADTAGRGGVYIADQGLYTWADYGVTPAKRLTTTTTGDRHVGRLAADPLTPGRWYLISDQGNTGRVLLRLAVGADGTLTSTDITPAGVSPASVAVDPTTGEVWVRQQADSAGGVGLWKSPAGGGSFAAWLDFGAAAEAPFVYSSKLDDKGNLFLCTDGSGLKVTATRSW